MGGSEIFLKPKRRGALMNGWFSDIFLKSNGSLIVYCTSDKHQKAHSIGERNIITY